MPRIQPERTIALATADDVQYIVHLQKLWSNQVGFLPRCALQRYVDHQSTILVKESGQHAGYLNWTLTKKGLLRFIQVAIDPPLLRTALGTRLVRHIEAAARFNRCSLIRFQCRTDLDANLAWSALGFKPTALYQHQTARGLPSLEWTKLLLDPTPYLPPPTMTGGSRSNDRPHQQQ